MGAWVEPQGPWGEKSEVELEDDEEAGRER